MSVFLSLGSNMGDRLFYLREAIERLTHNPSISIAKKSGIYVTAPWGGVEQPEFWNMAIQVETLLPPRELLRVCQAVENSLGRERIIRWGQRTIDIDILLYDNIVSIEPELILPHPHMEEREFVLAPLREIVPKLILPSGRPIAEVKGNGEVRLLPV